MIDELSFAKIVAHKVINPKTFSQLTVGLERGVTPVDMRLHVAGAVKRGNPYSKRVASKINPWKLLAKALSKLNQTTVDALVVESLNVSDVEHKAVAEKAQQAIDRLVAATETEMPGNVTATLNLEVL